MLDLHGDVADPELAVHDLVKHVYGLLMTGGVGDHDVTPHGRVAAGERPYVQVVDFLDAGYGPERGMHVAEVDVAGDGLEQDVDGLADEAPGADEDQECDNDGYDRVGRHPAGEEDDESGGDGADGAEQVAEHVEVCAPEVEVVAGGGVEQECGDDVDDQPGSGDAEHQCALNVLRLSEPRVCLPQDDERYDDERGAVDESGEDLDAHVAVRLGGGCRAS